MEHLCLSHRGLMESWYPTPSPSHAFTSHASSVLRAAIGIHETTTPRLPRHQPNPNHTLSGDEIEDDMTSVSLPVPVYRYFGLASDFSSTIGDSTDCSEPASKHIQPLVLLALPRPPGPGYIAREATHGDVFGPVHHHLTEYAQRRATAEHAGRIKQLRTVSWIRKLRRDTARGVLLEDESLT